MLSLCLRTLKFGWKMIRITPFGRPSNLCISLEYFVLFSSIWPKLYLPFLWGKEFLRPAKQCKQDDDIHFIKTINLNLYQN